MDLPKIDETDSGQPAPATKRSAANSTADRAIEILLVFSEERPVWTAAALATRFDMPKSTTYRYINGLKARGLITGDDYGGLRLGSKIIDMARIAAASASIVELAQPILEAVAAQFGELVSFSERNGFELTQLIRIESRHQVRIDHMRGGILPWPATAAAKTLLAYCGDIERKTLLKQMVPQRYTARTIADRKGLEREFRKIRSEGYAISDGERDEGVRGIAAPVFLNGHCHHCVTVGGPSFRLDGPILHDIVAAVKAAAAAVTSAAAAFDLKGL